MTEYDEYGRQYYDWEDDLYGIMESHLESYVEYPEPEMGFGGDNNYDAWDEEGNKTHTKW